MEEKQEYKAESFKGDKIRSVYLSVRTLDTDLKLFWCLALHGRGLVSVD